MNTSSEGSDPIAGDKDPEWGTSGVSDRATSILVVSQRPPECHQCASAAFRRRRQNGVTTLAKLPLSEHLLQCLEMVDKLEPQYPAHQMQQYRY